MKSQQQLTTERLKRENGVKNFRYNRYLLLRYLLAVCFFTNLYWALGLVMSQSGLAIIPCGLLVISMVAIMEHVKLYGAKNTHSATNLQGNFIYHLIQVSLSIGLFLSVLTNIGFTEFYPFLTQTRQTRMIMLVVLGVGILISFTCLRRIQRIRHNQDKHYGYMQEFEKSI